MKRFGLYHPGGSLAAVVPRVGFLDKPGCIFILPGTARRPRHRRSATDGLVSIHFRPPGAGRTEIT